MGTRTNGFRCLKPRTNQTEIQMRGKSKRIKQGATDGPAFRLCCFPLFPFAMWRTVIADPSRALGNTTFQKRPCDVLLTRHQNKSQLPLSSFLFSLFSCPSPLLLPLLIVVLLVGVCSRQSTYVYPFNTYLKQSPPLACPHAPPRLPHARTNSHLLTMICFPWKRGGLT